MNIIVSIIIYLTFIFSINFELTEGKKLRENYIVFDKSSQGTVRLRSAEDTVQRREINPSLEEPPLKISHTEVELSPSKSLVEPTNKKLLESKNSTSSDSNATLPEDSTQSTNNSTSTTPFTNQSSPEIVQPTNESTTKEQITTDQNPTGNSTSSNDFSTDKNITFKPPVPSDATSSAPPFETGFVDATTFKGGMNHWDFEGEWAKYDLLSLRADIKPVPELQTSEDNVVFMTMMVSPVFLRKEFPPLTNATITLTFYLKTSNQGSMEMKGFISNHEGEKMIFDLSKKEIFEHNYLWCTNKYILGSYRAPFSVIIRLRSSARSLWAANAITVRGWHTSGHEEFPDYVESSTSTHPSSMIPTTDENHSANTTTTNDFNSTNSTENNGNFDEFNDNSSSSTESLKDLAHIATAIWDAFYVFLALFCACLLALIILIVKQRCRDDPMPPAMATYSPRVSSYQVGKPRDNPSYETDSV